MNLLKLDDLQQVCGGNNSISQNVYMDFTLPLDAASKIAQSFPTMFDELAIFKLIQAVRDSGLDPKNIEMHVSISGNDYSYN